MTKPTRLECIDIEMREMEQLIEQVTGELYESETPLSIDAITQRIDVEGRGETKLILRKMIGQGLISSTPEWHFKLGTQTKRSVGAGSDRGDE